MTWVVGMPTVFGNCIGLADIQATITFPDGRKEYHDCVRKIYAVGNCMAAGFSGSIKIGFDLIDDLQQMLATEKKEVKWDPNKAALQWKQHAQQIYEKQERKSPTSILILGIFPKLEPGIDRTFGCIMRSPDFEVRPFSYGNVASIGSGNDVEEYISYLNEMNKTVYHPIMQLEVGNPGGYSRAFGFELTMQMKKKRADGISLHLHHCTVFPYRIIIDTNDYTFTPDDESPITEFIMPKYRPVQSHKKYCKLFGCVADGRCRIIHS